MIIGLVFRGMFFISIISWYSYGMFKMINEYFRSEYKTYLDGEVKKNKYLIHNQDETPGEQIKSFKMPQNLPPPDATPKSIDVKNKGIKEDCGGDEGIVNYWLNRKIDSNDDANHAHCHADEEKICKDN